MYYSFFTPSPGELVILALATWQAVEIRRHSPLFEEWDAVRENRPSTLLSRLWRCAWCLSAWVGFATYALWTGATLLECSACKSTQTNAFVLLATAFLVKTFLTGLAASRAANMLNDLLHSYCRTPGRIT